MKAAAELIAALAAPEATKTSKTLTEERAKVADWLGRAWDDGNAMGLDGYVGPNRGDEPDQEATHRRQRFVEKAIAALAAPEATEGAHGTKDGA